MTESDEVAAVLDEFADRLEAKGVEYKPRAYRDAAESVREASTDALREPHEIPDVGDAIASKIEELRETGSVDELDELREEFPVDIEALTRVEGVGPKTVGKLHDALGVTDLDVPLGDSVLRHPAVLGDDDYVHVSRRLLPSAHATRRDGADHARRFLDALGEFARTR